MKNNLLKISLVFITIIFVAILSSRYLVQNVRADSGWDSSYDSGGSWDSGSDWGSSSDWSSSSDWNSSSSSGSGGSVELNFFVATVYFIALFPFAIIFILCIMSVFFPHSTENSNKLFNYNQLAQEEVDKIIPNFNIEEFNFKAYQIFYDVQIAWMNFDYDKLKELLTDELYNTYLMDLEALKIKNQKNTMNGFELIETKLVDLKEENNTYIAKVYLEVKFYDYIEDIKIGNVLRGTNSRKLNNTYILTFIKSKEEVKVKYCPNCGAKVEGNQTGVCEYCNSKLINETYDWVMSKKEKISQK